jgi:glutamine synthetase
MRADEVVTQVREEGVRFCDLEFTDIVGMAKAVTIPLDQLMPVIESGGRWFDGASLEGFVRVTESDMFLRPDLATLRVIPWERSRARVLCDVVQPDGVPFDGDPRARLRRVLAQAERMGYRYETAPEIEFFLMQRPDESFTNLIPFDRGSYFDLSSETVSPFWRDVMESLDDLHVPVEASHHEAADGQYEIDLQMMDALASADAIMATKQAIKARAAHHGLMATFLPKPLSGVNGSGMHIHQKLIDYRTGNDAFADAENSEFGVSSIGLHFIAGLLEHARGICAIIAPLVNSYKRLVPDYEAPIDINWGHYNQDMLVRVPRPSSHLASDIRIELRSPDPSCNPYLALTVMLAAGLDGITRELDCPPPGKELRRRKGPRRDAQSYRLPESLAQALVMLEADPLMRESLGALITDEFLEAKWQEWASYRLEVSHWELERYLGLF